MTTKNDETPKTNISKAGLSSRRAKKYTIHGPNFVFQRESRVQPSALDPSARVTISPRSFLPGVHPKASSIEK